MMHGCGAVIGSRKDHSSRVTGRPIKIRNEKRIKRIKGTALIFAELHDHTVAAAGVSRCPSG
jgi:hypothetical protein